MGCMAFLSSLAPRHRSCHLLTSMFLRHVDLKGNLIKAMMVMNWLNMLEVEKH